MRYLLQGCFFEDVLFFPETPIERRENGISLDLRFNAQKAEEYSAFAAIFLQNTEVFFSNIMDLFGRLDTAAELTLSKKQIHKMLLTPLLDDRLTGLSFLNLMAYHMVKIIEDADNKNSYTVFYDTTGFA